MIYNPIIGGKKLPLLSNPGTANDLLEGKQLIDQFGNPLTGVIPIKTASDLSVSGPNIIVPVGYYSSQSQKSVATTTQATPTISVSSTGLITASSTQSAGYVSAGTKRSTKQLTNRTASDVTINTNNITVPAGYYNAQVQKSVATTTQATPTINVSSTGLITASSTQSEGYVASGTKKATKQLTNRTASDVTVSANNITVPSGYYNAQVQKSVATTTQATPSISVSTGGLITASSTQSAGYTSGGTKSSTKQLTVQAGKTIIPSTVQQTAVSSQRYTTGNIYVQGDPNLIGSNIKSGVSIFGVTGTSSGGVADYAIDHVTATDDQLIEFDMLSIRSEINSESDIIFGFITYMGITDVSHDPDYQIISMAFIYDASDLENGGRGRYIQYISSATEVDYDSSDINFVFNYNMATGKFRIYSDQTNYTFATADTYRLVLFYTSYV